MKSIFVRFSKIKEIHPSISGSFLFLFLADLFFNDSEVPEDAVSASVLLLVDPVFDDVFLKFICETVYPISSRLSNLEVGTSPPSIMEYKTAFCFYSSIYSSDDLAPSNVFYRCPIAMILKDSPDGPFSAYRVRVDSVTVNGDPEMPDVVYEPVGPRNDFLRVRVLVTTVSFPAIEANMAAARPPAPTSAPTSAPLGTGLQQSPPASVFTIDEPGSGLGGRAASAPTSASLTIMQQTQPVSLPPIAAPVSAAGVGGSAVGLCADGAGVSAQAQVVAREPLSGDDVRSSNLVGMSLACAGEAAAVPGDGVPTDGKESLAGVGAGVKTEAAGASYGVVACVAPNPSVLRAVITKYSRRRRSKKLVISKHDVPSSAVNATDLTNVAPFRTPIIDVEDLLADCYPSCGACGQLFDFEKLVSCIVPGKGCLECPAGNCGAVTCIFCLSPTDVGHEQDCVFKIPSQSKLAEFWRLQCAMRAVEQVGGDTMCFPGLLRGLMDPNMTAYMVTVKPQLDRTSIALNQTRYKVKFNSGCANSMYVALADGVFADKSRHASIRGLVVEHYAKEGNVERKNIVMSGAFSDRSDLRAAIRLLHIKHITLHYWDEDDLVETKVTCGELDGPELRLFVLKSLGHYFLVVDIPGGCVVSASSGSGSGALTRAPAAIAAASGAGYAGSASAATSSVAVTPTSSGACVSATVGGAGVGVGAFGDCVRVDPVAGSTSGADGAVTSSAAPSTGYGAANEAGGGCGNGAGVGAGVGVGALMSAVEDRSAAVDGENATR